MDIFQLIVFLLTSSYEIYLQSNLVLFSKATDLSFICSATKLKRYRRSCFLDAHSRTYPWNTKVVPLLSLPHTPQLFNTAAWCVRDALLVRDGQTAYLHVYSYITLPAIRECHIGIKLHVKGSCLKQKNLLMTLNIENRLFWLQQTSFEDWKWNLF